MLPEPPSARLPAIFAMWFDGAGLPQHSLRVTDGTLFCAVLNNTGEWMQHAHCVPCLNPSEMAEAFSSYYERVAPALPSYAKIWTIHVEPIVVGYRRYLLKRGMAPGMAKAEVRSVIDDLAAIVPWDLQRRIACRPEDLELLDNAELRFSNLYKGSDSPRGMSMFMQFAGIATTFLIRA